MRQAWALQELESTDWPAEFEMSLGLHCALRRVLKWTRSREVGLDEDIVVGSPAAECAMQGGGDLRSLTHETSFAGGGGAPEQVAFVVETQDGANPVGTHDTTFNVGEEGSRHASKRDPASF